MGKMEQALAEFGQSIGLSALEPGANGHVQLRFDSGALLGVSTQGEEVVLHYAEPVPYDAAALVFKAMKKVSRTESAAVAVQVGLRTTAQGEWLVVATRQLQDRFSAREAQRLGDYLQAWVAQLRDA